MKLSSEVKPAITIDIQTPKVSYETHPFFFVRSTGKIQTPKVSYETCFG